MSTRDEILSRFRQMQQLGLGTALEIAAVELIEQQGRDIAALKDDIEAQIRIASEEATLADACLTLLREIAELKRHNANVARPHLVNNYHVLSAPRELMDRIDAVLSQKQEG